MSNFPVLSEEQVEMIVGSTPGPDGEEALSQWLDGHGHDHPNEARFVGAHALMRGAWDRVWQTRTLKNLHVFWDLQSRCLRWLEDGETLDGSALGLTPRQALKDLRPPMTERARKGLRELELRERELRRQLDMY